MRSQDELLSAVGIHAYGSPVPRNPSLTGRNKKAYVALLVALVVVAATWQISTADVAAPDESTGQADSRSSRAADPLQKNTVLAVGDTYTQGSGATIIPGSEWVSLLSNRTGWDIVNLAQGGTGYVSAFTTGGATSCGTPTCLNYAGQLAAYRGSTPAAILVSGGRYDVGVPQAKESRAIEDFFDAARAQFPDAKIVAFSPLWDDDDPPVALTPIAAAVQRSVARVNGAYVDLGQPLRGKKALVNSDGFSPNDDGYAVLASAIYKALAARNLT